MAPGDVYRLVTRAIQVVIDLLHVPYRLSSNRCCDLNTGHSKALYKTCCDLRNKTWRDL